MPLEVKCISVRENFQCCCCNCTVKTGSILIGWLQLDISLVQLLHFIASIFDIRRLLPNDVAGHAIGILIVIGICLFVNGILVFSARRGISILVLPYLLLGLVALAIMCIIVFRGITHLFSSPREIANLFGNMVLSLLVTVQLAVRLSIETLLLYGAYREKPMFMLPYVVLDPVGVLWVASLILLVAIHLAGQVIIAYVAVLILDSLLMGVRSYMWVIVYSYYRQLVGIELPHTEIPLQNMYESQPMVNVVEALPQKESMQFMNKVEVPPTPEVPSHKNPIELWPSSREYLL